MKPTPSDPRSPKAVWDQQHEFALNDPLMWQLKADSLAAAFDVLIEDDIRRKLESARARRIPSVEYMLAGFALENLLKGQLIARHKHRDETGAFKLKTHDLRQLARDAGYEMSEPENRLLEKIQEFANGGPIGTQLPVGARREASVRCWAWTHSLAIKRHWIPRRPYSELL